MKTGGLIIIAITFYLFFYAATPSYADNIIRVGVYDFKPIVFTDEHRQADGLYIDVLKYIAEKELWNIKYVPGTWQECLNRLKMGEIDILPSIAYSEERAEKFDFTKNFLYMLWGQLYQHKDSKIETVFDLEGKTIGCLKGSQATEDLKNMLHQFGIKADFFEQDNYATIFESVHKKEFDVGISTNIFGTSLESRYDVKQTRIVFSPTKLYFAVGKDRDILLLNTLDRYLTKLKADKNSVYYELYDKWMGFYHKESIFTRWFWGVSFIVGSIALILMVFIVVLKQQVRLKTSELEKNNETLRRNEEKLSKIFQASTGGIAITTVPEGRFLEVNEPFLKGFGFAREEVIGKTSSELNVWADISVRDRALSSVYTRKENIRFEAAFRKKNNELLYALVSLTPINIDGIDCVLTTGVDITDRNLAEEALKESESRYRSMYDAMSEGAALHELVYNDAGIAIDYRITDVNPAYEKLTDIRREDAAGSLASHLYRTDSPPYLEIYAKIAESGEPFQFETYFAPIKKHFSISVYSPKKGWFATIFSDITDRKTDEEERNKLESRLRQAQNMEALGTLAGGIAHDFNNILFPIVGYTEMTMDDMPEDNRALNNLQEVLKAAHRAKELVNQILTFSRQKEHEKIMLNVQPIIKEALKLIRATLPATIKIVQKIDSNCASVMGDPVHIHQIMMNLCTNAYHAMQDREGILEVRLTETELSPYDLTEHPDSLPGTYLKLSVSDTGIGIPQNIQERIFDPFFTTKPVGKGTGLGLSVIHGIVKQMGGHIRLYSEPGHGTVFHVYIPAITSETIRKPDDSDSNDPIPMGSERILLVDDEEPILNMLHKMLEELGYKIIPRTSSVEAFKAFQNRPDSFDLVITDMTMPNMTGAYLARKILKIRKDIPIILCTGFSENINAEKSKDLGIRGYLMKPVIRREIAKIIRKVLEEMRSEK